MGRKLRGRLAHMRPDARIEGTWDHAHTYWCCMCKRRFYGSHIAVGAVINGQRRFLCVYCEYTLWQ